MPGVKNPHVCFLMPTYGRAFRQPSLLDEAVYWFSRQLYPLCELLILNDCKGQTLRCDVPRVTVVNSEYRYPTLGDKMNAMVELAPPGSVCAVYEDDDVILPWRAGMIANCIRDVEFWSPGKWWYCCEGFKPQADGNGYGYTSCAFRREPALGKHPSVTKAHDGIFVKWGLHNLATNVQHGLFPDSEIAYCYRWGVSQMHLSGTGNPEYQYTSFNPGKPGTYDIAPLMGRDYVAETQAVIKAKESSNFTP